MKILVRVDAYPNIALGHLNRCINLGISLRNHGHDVTFFCYNDPEADLMLSLSGFEYTLTTCKINDKQNKDEELSFLKKISSSIDLLLVDSYNIDDSYIDCLNEIFPVIGYLDDMGFDFDVDLVINPSCEVQEKDYQAEKVLCGLKYVILGKKFNLGRQNELSFQKKTIIITMGGADHYNLSSRAIPILEEISKDIEVNIIAGPYYENIELIRSAANQSCLSINVFENVSNLAPIMLRSNIALTAGGFTSYELAALSIPSVGIALWENQYGNIKCLSNRGALLPLYYPYVEDLDKELAYELYKLINDDDLAISMSKKARNAVDGNGANRISEEITKYYE